MLKLPRTTTIKGHFSALWSKFNSKFPKNISKSSLLWLGNLWRDKNFPPILNSKFINSCKYLTSINFIGRKILYYTELLRVTCLRDHLPWRSCTQELANYPHTALKMKFSIEDFFGKCGQIRSFLRIWSNLLRKSLMENFINDTQCH